MRARSIISSAALAAVALASPALAGGTGPSGSSEDDANQVTCNGYPNEPTRADVEQKPGGVAVHGNTGTVYAGTNGAEACGDNGGSWRGRAYVTPSGATYDGATWASDPQGADNLCVSATTSGLAYC